MYGDCEARGSFAADPYGIYNPGVLAVGAAAHMSRGVILSGSYYDLDVGGVDGDIGVGAVTFAYEPLVFQVAIVYAEARGAVRPLPGVDMSFRTRVVRLAAGIDAGRVLGLRGLSVGLAGVVPGTKSDLRLKAGGATFVESTETRAVEIIPGIHWRTGEQDWFMTGAFLDATRNDLSAHGTDPITGSPLRRSGTINTWFARVGISVLPFVPLGLTEGDLPRAQWLRRLRIGTDVEYRNISVPDEPGEQVTIAYFGADGPLLPDALNPLADWVLPWFIGGVDTRGDCDAGSHGDPRGNRPRMVGHDRDELGSDARAGIRLDAKRPAERSEGRVLGGCQHRCHERTGDEWKNEDAADAHEVDVRAGPDESRPDQRADQCVRGGNGKAQTRCEEHRHRRP